jgi:hypothetical protein
VVITNPRKLVIDANHPWLYHISVIITKRKIITERKTSYEDQNSPKYIP